MERKTTARQGSQSPGGRQQRLTTANPSGVNRPLQPYRTPSRSSGRIGAGGGPKSSGQRVPAAAAGGDERIYMQQLQMWAQATVTRDLPQIVGEFARLQQLPRPQPSPEFIRNAKLNRYRDVPCVDNNRVQLPNGQYIHANYIESNGERRFICTQGPLPHTVDDFWNMIIQERIDAIVMLCDTVELGRPKCFQYWPVDAGAQPIQSADGNVQVTYLDQENLDTNIRKTRLQVLSMNPKMQVIVRHLQWIHWPDRGVPLHHLAPLRLLHFLTGYRKVVVHCSAGIGRTGTIVAIYCAQNQMRAGQTLDLYELVRNLRQQRAGSVQTLDQYLYIYSVLLRYAKNKADRKQIQLDVVAADRLIEAISQRIYRTPQ